MPRTLAAVLFGFSLLIYFPTVAADSTPYPADIEFRGWEWYAIPPNRGGYRGGSPRVSAADACRGLASSFNAGSYSYVGFTYYGNSISKGDCLLQQVGSGEGAPTVWWSGDTRGWQRYAICTRGGYVDDWEAATPKCVCSPGYQFPPGGIVTNYQQCVPDTCPVNDMLPHPTDACSVSLENSGGLRPASPPICPADETKNDPNGEPCFKEKMALLGIPYAGPSGTVRTLGYQKHLYDLWSKDRQHKAVIKGGDPAKIAACAEKKKVIDNEINNIHGGLDIPTDGTAPDTHSKGRAFDVSRNTAKALESRMRQDANNIFAWLFAPPPRSCNLKWGGDFQDEKDPVHFQLLK